MNREVALRTDTFNKSIIFLQSDPDNKKENNDFLSCRKAVEYSIVYRLAALRPELQREKAMMNNEATSSPSMHATTILMVHKGNELVIGGDGQVSLGPTIVKGNARKVRRLSGGKVIAGFAGATADAFTLFERLEAKLEQYRGQLLRSCVELTKDWRTDRYLRRLEAMMLVADKETGLLLSGSGDVLEPEGGIAAIGSGGNYALAAARALADSDLSAEDIVRKSLAIAADICVYTNHNIVIEKLQSELKIGMVTD